MRITIKEAALHWKVDRRTIERWIEDGKLIYELTPSGRKIIIGIREVKNNGVV